MQAALAELPIAVDEAGMVSADVPCRACSYNLRGLHQDSNCPECANPVKLSLRGDLLRYCDPKWVRRLLIGGTMIFWSIVATILLMCVSNPFGSIFRIWPYYLIGFVISLLGVVGTWMLTTADPAGHERPNTAIARNIARWALLLALGRSIIVLWRFWTLHPMLSALLGVALVMVALARIAGELARLYYIQQLARRVPDEKMSRRVRKIMWGYGISMGLLTLISTSFTFMSMTLKQPPSMLGDAWIALSWIMELGWFVVIMFLIGYALLLAGLLAALQQAEIGQPPRVMVRR